MTPEYIYYAPENVLLSCMLLIGSTGYTSINGLQRKNKEIHKLTLPSNSILGLGIKMVTAVLLFNGKGMETT